MNHYSSTGAAGLPAVVLACAGAPEGDLNVVRSLGEQGVPVVVIGEYADPPSRFSRHCVEFIQVSGFSQQPQALLAVLADLAAQCGDDRAEVLAWLHSDAEAETVVAQEARIRASA